MQRCICEIRLGGDLLNTVEKRGVSPAEVLILQHVHGDGSVVNLRPNGNDRGRAIDEKGDLQDRYPRFFKEVFPGSAPVLPESFKDIGIDLLADGDDADAVKPAGKARKGAKAKPSDKGVQTLTASEIDAHTSTGDDDDNAGESGDDAEQE